MLGTDAVVRDAAYMWTRHRWMVHYGAAVFAAAVLFAPIAGIDDWPTRVAIGLALVAMAVTATTDYRVVAQTDQRLVLLKASRIRQVATALEKELSRTIELTPAGGTVLGADWQVGDHRYTVSRSSEQAMNRMAAARSAES